MLSVFIPNSLMLSELNRSEGWHYLTRTNSVMKVPHQWSFSCGFVLFGIVQFGIAELVSDAM